MEQQLKIQFPSIIRNKNKQTEFFGILRSTDVRMIQIPAISWIKPRKHFRMNLCWCHSTFRITRTQKASKSK